MILRKWLSTLLALSLAAAVSCGKKADDEEDEATDDAKDKAIESVNALAVAYPNTLAIAAFPEGESSKLALGETAVEDPNADKDVSQKVDDAEKVLTGEADECLNEKLFQRLKAASDPSCYEFDSDLMPISANYNGKIRTNGTLTGEDEDSGEACLVAFARAQIKDSVTKVDKATSLIQAMLCQAKKDGSADELPAVGKSIDLQSTLENAAGKLKISRAKITRLEDVDDRPVYKSEVTMTDFTEQKIDIDLVHSPAKDGTNDTYNGVLSVKFTGGKYEGLGSNKIRAMSVVYARSESKGKKKMKYEVRNAALKDTLEPFNGDGTVDFNAGAVFTGTKATDGYGNYGTGQPNDFISGMKYIEFDVDPDTNEGNLSYWVNPGGQYYENARGFLFNIAANDDGDLSGCGVSGATGSGGVSELGAGISIRRALKEGADDKDLTLEPRGYLHPFANNNTLTAGEKDDRQPGQRGTTITKQCFKRNSEGKYVIDTKKTTHAHGYDIIEGSASTVKRPAVNIFTDVKPPEVKN